MLKRVWRAWIVVLSAPLTTSTGIVAGTKSSVLPIGWKSWMRSTREPPETESCLRTRYQKEAGKRGIEWLVVDARDGVGVTRDRVPRQRFRNDHLFLRWWRVAGYGCCPGLRTGASGAREDPQAHKDAVERANDEPCK